MNQTYLAELLDNASDETRRLNAGLAADGARPVAKLEPDSRAGTLGSKQVKGADRGRFYVRVTSYRKRLLDQDNLCEKYHIDLCRYAGALPDDAPGTAQIEVGQVKTGKGETERTEIEIWRINI